MNEAEKLNEENKAENNSTESQETITFTALSLQDIVAINNNLRHRLITLMRKERLADCQHTTTIIELTKAIRELNLEVEKYK